uniref:Carboxylesterase type B domain-containing protein n=2 Tax=Alexandrium monilatum TaxID=311494 RepID=A0A7S4V4S9_9DINO
MAPFGAMHLLELSLLLEDEWLIDRGGRGFGAGELALGSEMRSRWAQFAAKGRPGDGWPPCNATSTEALVLGGGGSPGKPWHGGAILSFHASWQGLQVGRRQRTELQEAARFV